VLDDGGGGVQFSDAGTRCLYGGRGGSDVGEGRSRRAKCKVGDGSKLLLPNLGDLPRCSQVYSKPHLAVSCLSGART
jgi:hypothetical protein